MSIKKDFVKLKWLFIIRACKYRLDACSHGEVVTVSDGVVMGS